MKALLILWLGTAAAWAQLTVTVSPPKVAGSKAVVPLAMKNSFVEPIESARAVVFLSDENGKVVGQATHWVIGGDATRPALSAGATNVFHFVLTSDEPFTTTNLTAKVSFSRVVLESGKLANPTKEVILKSPAQ